MQGHDSRIIQYPTVQRQEQYDTRGGRRLVISLMLFLFYFISKTINISDCFFFLHRIYSAILC